MHIPESESIYLDISQIFIAVVHHYLDTFYLLAEKREQ